MDILSLIVTGLTVVGKWILPTIGFGIIGTVIGGFVKSILGTTENSIPLAFTMIGVTGGVYFGCISQLQGLVDFAAFCWNIPR